MDFEGAFFNTNDFELTGKELGKGSFGRVYLVKKLSDNTNYAVKIIKTENGFNGHEQMLFMRESLILHKLHHPSIIKFIGINLQSFETQKS